MTRARVAPLLLLPCVAVFVALAVPPGGASARIERRPPAPSVPVGDREVAARAAVGGESPRATPDPGAATVAPGARPAQPVLGPMRLDPARGRYVASYGDRTAVLSISPRLQEELEKILASFRVPMGAVVLLEPGTGRILAMAETGNGARSRVSLEPIAPAASIFKIVTTAALLDRGVAPDAEVCFHGGNHRIQKALLTDNPRRDHRCLTLSSALGKSANVVFAKLAGRELTAEKLRAEAARFLFNAPIPFDWPVQPSPAHIPEDRFELATTAAGFGPVRMSPLHGAILAGLVANRGTFVPPRIVDEVDGAAAPAGEPRRLVRPDVAEAIARMMRTTTTEGTARKVFGRDRVARRSPLHGVAVAGKTGSLADAAPFRDYSWFVGFAPADRPKVVVSAVIVNEKLWRVKAPFVAHEALEAYFGGRRATPAAGRSAVAARSFKPSPRSVPRRSAPSRAGRRPR